MLRYGLEKKKAFHDEKKVNFLSPKNESFPKGLTHGIGQKNQIFFSFIFWKNRLRNNVDLWSEEKQSLSEQ